jgi:zinc protease
MKRLILLLMMITIVFSSMSFADDSKIFPYKYEMKDLDNGLRVIVIPTDYPNLVSLQIPVMTGSRNEVEPGKSGFAHFFEHMMFRGTENYSADEYGDILKNIGADQNAYTSDDLTNYHINFSKEDLETVLMLEADRFKYLQYSVEDFKTESRAVLGEYNKNYANPIRKLIEVQRDNAFQKHTYKHTTMGFIEDIEDMPNEYEYSREFFNRYYRPEYSTIIIAGDVDIANTFKLVEKYWGDWKRGNYKVEIPAEPPQQKAVYAHVKWQTPTLPMLTVAFHGPAFSDSKPDMAVMDIISNLEFSQSSELFNKLVIKEQKVDQMFSYFPDRIDPYLVTVFARLKDAKDMDYVREEILKTFAKLRTEGVSAKRLNEIKSNLRYSFASGMNSSQSIAEALVGYVSKTKDPETVNKVYRLYESVTPQDVKAIANKYFVDNGLVVTTLSHEDLSQESSKAGSINAIVNAETGEVPAVETLFIRNNSPLINFRILFNTGAAFDPEGKQGLAKLTADMITEASSKSMKFQEIQKAFFPMAAGFGNQVDKEMTVFTGTIHKDNLESYYSIISDMLLNPAWDESDFERVKNNLINYVKVNLRDNNDEELGKEVLYEMIYEGHPYGHLNEGHIEALNKITLDDVKSFYNNNFTRANLVIGMAGNYSDEFAGKIKRDLASLPVGNNDKLILKQPDSIDGFEATIVEKETRATAISFGFPIDLTRSDKDFTALWLVRSYFGEHRSSNSYLYQRIREIRGMNYGDYAYIEYFPRGMFRNIPETNLGRQQQIFQIWIRPVRPEQAHFATRTALYELNKLIENGLSQKDFDATKNFLLKYVNILVANQNRQLGYALDSKYYGIGEFTEMIKQNLKNLTLEDVNQAISKYLQDENIKFVFITKDAQDLKNRLVNNSTSPITYDAEKPADILEEDKIIQDYQLPFKSDKVKIVKLDDVF